MTDLLVIIEFGNINFVSELPKIKIYVILSGISFGK